MANQKTPQQKYAEKLQNLSQAQRTESIQRSALYSKVDYYHGYVYIHLHQSNIGKALTHGEKSYKDADIAREFLTYKYSTEKDVNVAQAVQNQYVQLLKNSMINNATMSQYNFLNSVLDTKNNNYQNILDKINKALKQGFESQFTTDKITQMLRLEDRDNWSEKGESFQKIEQLLKGDNDAKGFEYLNNILERMSNAVGLLGTKEGADLMAIISNALTNNYVSPQVLGSVLTEKIEEFKNNQDGRTIASRDAIQAATLFQKVTKGLGGIDRTDPVSSAKSLQGLVQNNFYSYLAEIFASHLGKAAEEAAVKYVGETIQDINLVGDTPIALEETDSQGFYSEGSSRSFEGTSPAAGKADVKFNNVQVNLSFLTKRDLGTLMMSVGISNKAYVVNKIGGSSLKDFKKGDFSLGGGMTVGQALKMISGNNSNLRYLVFNTLAIGDKSNRITLRTTDGRSLNFLNKGLPLSYSSLQDILLTRCILYLAGARGKDDFANFLFVNGKLLSMWDIVKYVANKNLFLHKADAKGVRLSFSNQTLYQLYARDKHLAIRVEEANKTMDKCVMKGRIYPGLIAEQMKTI